MNLFPLVDFLQLFAGLVETLKALLEIHKLGMELYSASSNLEITTDKKWVKI